MAVLSDNSISNVEIKTAYRISLSNSYMANSFSNVESVLYISVVCDESKRNCLYPLTIS